MSRVLIADDQRDVLEALRILLKGEGHQTEAVTSISGIFNALQQRDYALLMMDLNYTRDTTSGQEGLEVIPKIQALDSTLPIVVMTAWATIDLAVEAMKRGARDFVPKPWDNERLLTIVRTQIELGSALRKGRKLEAANKLLGGNVPNLIADAPSMRPVIEMISASGAVGRERSDHRRKRHRKKSDCAGVACALAARVAQHDHGEHGRFVGDAFRERTVRSRERRVHRCEDRSRGTVRAGGRKHAVHGRDREHSAQSAGETVAGDRDRRVRAGRFVKNVARECADHFRDKRESDMTKSRPAVSGRTCLFRLNTIEIELPPLRDRREDIMPLANNFLRQHAQRYRKELGGFDEAARDRLMQHSYPGNVRELDHVIERAVLMTHGTQIKAADLGLTTGGGESQSLEDMSLEEVEAFLIKKALARNNGNARKAAESLGLSRSAFYRRLQQYGL